MMALTEAEKEIALGAKHFGLGWGQVLKDGTQIFCPAAAVAKARGANFKRDSGEMRVEFLVPNFADDCFNSACIDVAHWLGFATWDDYAKALQTERQDILKRAR